MRKMKIVLYLLLIGTVFSTMAMAQTFEGKELLPPEAKVGECYARVFVPATYETYEETVLKTEASERIEIIPAQYNWETKEVMVKGAGERLEVVPATYKWTEEEVLVSEESYRIEKIPAVYETVSETILEKPAHTVWKEGADPIEKVLYHTGEILCLVEVPATYKTVYQRKLVKSAAIRNVSIPAKYETIRKRVMATPPTVNKVVIPAEYDTVKVKVVAEEAAERRIPIPAEYETITKQKQVSEGKMEWRRILCRTNVSPGIVQAIQAALKDAGHYPGPIDGVIGSQTMSAVRSFQTAEGLPVGNLTYNTLEKLGIDISKYTI